MFSVYTCSIRCPAMQCACAILSFVSCPALQYFSKLSHKSHDFRGKKINIKYAFCFSLQLLSETSVILQTIQRAIINLYISLHVECSLFLSDLMKLECSRYIIRKYLNIKFLGKPSSSNWFPCGQTEGRKRRS